MIIYDTLPVNRLTFSTISSSTSLHRIAYFHYYTIDELHPARHRYTARDDTVDLLLFQMQQNLLRNEKLKEAKSDVDKFNSFLYYYIAPDLPLDEELVDAAKRSTAENYQKPGRRVVAGQSRWPRTSRSRTSWR